jgi:hypothetical protein
MPNQPEGRVNISVQEVRKNVYYVEFGVESKVYITYQSFENMLNPLPPFCQSL